MTKIMFSILSFVSLFHSYSASVEGLGQLHRTGFHFQPVKNFMNDPNGPMHYNGVYHLFYQYNPDGAVPGDGNTEWGHSVSQDLINWKHVQPAISPSKPFDKYGCFSGSATILPNNKPVLLYTGVVDSFLTEVQNYAIPENLSDPFLVNWTKPDNNPLIVPERGIDAFAFRDPTTAWLGKDGFWRIIIGNGKRKGVGKALLYKSKDFLNWVRVKHPLHSVNNTGMWECPDFYPVSVTGTKGLDNSVIGGNIKHVMKVSLNDTRFEYYTVGRYDIRMDRYVPDNGSIDGFDELRYDYGNFYASKTFFDQSTGRRILWGCANESDTREDDVKKGWAGIQAVPRQVWLDGKQIMQWPVTELESLRGERVEIINRKLFSGQLLEIAGIGNYSPVQADVEVIFRVPNLDNADPFNSTWTDPQELCSQMGSNIGSRLGPFGLLTLASKNLEEFTPVFFRIFKSGNKHVVLLCSDARPSSLLDKLYKPSFGGFVNVNLSDGKLSLRTLIDHSVVESFGGGGKTCILSRIYPSLAVGDGAHLFAFNNGTESVMIERLTAWKMKNALIS